MAEKRREKLLQQVDQLWSTLDEMSESNPEAYRRFIRQQLGEGVKQLAAPVPHGCFQTRITEPGQRLLYVNVCSWGRLPAPKSDSEPVPLAGGALEETADGTDNSSVTDVAFSPEVLQRGSQDPVERDQLIRLAIKYIEEQHRLHLSPSYRLLPEKLHGSVEQLRRRLAGRPGWVRGGLECTDPPPRRWLAGQESAGSEREAEAPPIRLPGDAGLPSKPGLIQEISSTEFEPSDGIQTPAYEMSAVKDENGNARLLELKVELPGVSSVAECDLSVSEGEQRARHRGLNGEMPFPLGLTSGLGTIGWWRTFEFKDDVVIDVPDKYRLQVNLPHIISEDAVRAKFNRKSHVLSVRIPTVTK